MGMIILARNSPLCFNNPMRKEAAARHRPQFWPFRPDIGVPNIKAKLTENFSNIMIAGQTDLLTNGWTRRTESSARHASI